MNENKVLSFIDQIEAERQNKRQDTELTNSMEYKYKCLQKAKDECRKECLSKIFEKFYLNSIPLNDEYKNACCDEIKSDIPGFVKHRGCDDLVYYVGEAINKGSEPAARIMKCVNNIVDESFKDKEMNIKDYNASDLVFKMDDDTAKKIDVVTQDLELDDLSQIISDNVKSTAAAEIMRAKREKDEAKALETDLANNLDITNEAAIDFALELRGMKEKKIFQPSLFEGIMLGKLEKSSLMAESGSSTYLYNALSDYGFESNSSFASPEEIAFVESVREYTLLNISKALKLEKFNLATIREMAQDYASNM
jgi:hypothetical protein